MPDRSDEHDYLAREARARLEIDKQLVAAGWSVQSQESLNLSASPGVAVREFTLESRTAVSTICSSSTASLRDRVQIAVFAYENGIVRPGRKT